MQRATAVFSLLLLRITQAIDMRCSSTNACCADSFDNSQLSVLSNVQYCIGESAPFGSITTFSVPLVLDVYYPTSLQNAAKAAIVLVHGGSYSASSSKTGSFVVDHAKAWARRSFAVFVIEYRRWAENSNLANSDRLRSDPVHDLLAALRYIRANSGTYKIGDNSIAICGISTGGEIVAHASILQMGLGSSGNSGESSSFALSMVLSGGIFDAYFDTNVKSRKNTASIKPYLAIHSLNDATVNSRCSDTGNPDEPRNAKQFVHAIGFTACTESTVDRRRRQFFFFQ